MFDKIINSWILAKQCWRVLVLDKEMLVFPLISFITTLLALALVIYPVWACGYFIQQETIHLDLNKIFNLQTFMLWVLLALIPTYICYLIMTFYNAGLITCAFIRLKGGDPVISDGFYFAWKRMPQIFTWSILAATVGLILRLIKGRNSVFRSFLGGTLGLGWRIASFFAVPVIVAEEKGAIDALKCSGNLVKKNWGEALTLEIGFSILAFPVLAPSFILLFISGGVSDAIPALSVILTSVAFIYIILTILIFSTLDAIAKAALYMFATGEKISENFDREILETVFKRKSAETPALV